MKITSLDLETEIIWCRGEVIVFHVSTIHTEYEVGIHRRSNWYSETPQYRDPNLTYKQAIAAYDGMVAANFIRVAKYDYLDRDTGRSDVTKVIATDSCYRF